jgi:serine/threonine protein kinase
LLSKAANEARERNDDINYLKKTLETASSEKGGNNYQQNYRMPPPQHRASGSERHSGRKAAPPPPPPIQVPTKVAQSTRHNPLPPNTNKSDDVVGIYHKITTSKSHDLVGSESAEEEIEKVALQFNNSYTFQQQQQQQGRVHRPVPARAYLSNPSTPTTQTLQRPVITVAAAMDYIMSASARPPSGHDDAKNTNDIYDEVDQEMDESCKDHAPLDISKMKRFLNAIVGRVDIEVGAASITSSHGKNATTTPSQKHIASSHNSARHDDSESNLTTEKYDNDFDRNTSLSMHAEAKFGSSSGQLSKHAEDKHRVRGEQPQQSSASSRRSSKSVDPPGADDDDHDIEIHHEKQLPPRTVSERLPEIAALNHEEFAEEPCVFDQALLSRLAPYEDISSDGVDVKMSRALGPRSQRPGGITGVVLDGGSSSDDTRDYANQTNMMRMNSRTESPAVSVPNSSTDNDPRSPLSDDLVDGGSHGESRKQSRSEELSGDGVNGKSNVLMMKLCSHLLPAGIDAFEHWKDTPLGTELILNKINLEWDDDDPDEPGCVVHRLTNTELTGVENAFKKLVTSLERTSEKHVRDGSNDENFERDLEEAELILDQEETRYESEVKQGNNASETSKNDGAELQMKHQENGVTRESVPDFPGIYPSGKGMTGEMECFYLPIITNSQKTGFEPTKDLVLKSGSVFANNYLVQCELGSAAFSTAYRCLDLSSEEDEDGFQDEVCLKVIKNTKDYFDQSLDEIKILQLLKNTGKVKENNIVEMKSFFYHREHLVIVTELLRQNLYEFGKSIIESRGSLYFTRLRLSHITRQCLIALKFVHELGLIHCDIKPENILLCSYSRALIKIIDFGSSSFVSDRQSSYIQSRSYRAPEVILGLPYDGKIDMWSLGCVIAEMYTNEVTFQNDSELSMLSRIEAICGPFPRLMIAKGRNSHRIFTDSGLIYEKISPDDDEEERTHGSSDDDTEKPLFRVYQPKMTTIAARLGFDEDLMDQPQLSDDVSKCPYYPCSFYIR